MSWEANILEEYLIAFKCAAAVPSGSVLSPLALQGIIDVYKCTALVFYLYLLPFVGMLLDFTRHLQIVFENE